MKMKKVFFALLVLVASSVWSFAPCRAEVARTGPGHEPVTEQLITMVEHSPEIRRLLVESIAKARQRNPDRATNPAQTIEEYYAFIDWAAKAMPWSILKHVPAPMLYDKIDQSLDYFYFINDQPLAELKDRDYYRNSLQYHEPYRTWLVSFVKEWGIYLSQPGSWTAQDYQAALADKRFGLDKGWYEDPANWKTFNQFFARYLKSPPARPIAAPGDPSVVASPADSKPQGVWQIDSRSMIVDRQGVGIKSGIYRSIPVLIGEGSAYREAFANGTLTHTFLDVNDYHRYHFPVSGVIREVRIIPADDAVGGIIGWNEREKRYTLDSNTPGWQNIETRGCVILDTETYGLVAILPIGMSQVSSVNFEKHIKPGTRVRKGDMLGYFLFGGSDIVMLFQKKVDFTLTVPKTEEKDHAFEHILMGEQYGKLTLRTP